MSDGPLVEPRPSTRAAAGIEVPGALGWYRELSLKERRTFWACFSGWSLDAMDANLYSFAIPALVTAWGITRGDASMLVLV